MQNQTIVQGKMHLQKSRGSPGYIGLVVPFENPDQWYYEPFPTLELAQHYAHQHSLVIEEEYHEPKVDSSPER